MELKSKLVCGDKTQTIFEIKPSVLYYNLLTSSKLDNYLADVEERAKNLFEQTVKSLAEQEQVTEKLKAENMMFWVQKMNNIRNRATEIVNEQVIYR